MEKILSTTENNESIKDFTNQSIKDFLQNDFGDDNETINQIYIDQNINVKLIWCTNLYSGNSLFSYDKNGKGFALYIKNENKELLGIMNAVYNNENDRFNIRHRLVKESSPIRGKELFGIIEMFVKGVASKFPKLKGREIYTRQRQIINRVTEKLGFEIDYDRCNDLGKAYIDHPNSKDFEEIDVYISNKNEPPLKGTIVSKNIYNADEIPVIEDMKGVVDIVLVKDL